MSPEYFVNATMMQARAKVLSKVIEWHPAAMRQPFVLDLAEFLTEAYA